MVADFALALGAFALLAKPLSELAGLGASQRSIQ